MPKLTKPKLWQKKRGFSVAVLTIVRTHYAFSQKMATGMNYFFILEYLLNMSFCHYFDQGRRSCPGASCIDIIYLYFELLHFKDNFYLLVP